MLCALEIVGLLLLLLLLCRGFGSNPDECKGSCKCNCKFQLSEYVAAMRTFARFIWILVGIIAVSEKFKR